jgi:hypothetical protein
MTKTKTLSRRERYKRRWRMAIAVLQGRHTGATARRFRVTLATVRRACMEFGVVPPRPFVRWGR